MKKQKPKIYLVTCYKCKKRTEKKEVVWANRLPICVHCIAERTVK